MVEQGLAILLVIGSLVYAPFLALVRRQAAVIAAPGGVGSALAAKAATSTIPIVIAGGADPVNLAWLPALPAQAATA